MTTRLQTSTDTGTLALPDLAERINQEHQRCTAAMKAGLEHALNAGRLLTQAKGLCEHGAWGKWLEDNFRGSQRTARVYMQVAKGRPEIEGKTAGSAVLSIDGALKLLAAPRPMEPAASDATLPEGFTPGPGRCLIGWHAFFPIAVEIAESIKSPGYWNIIIVDFRATSNIEVGAMSGGCRPITERYLGLGLQVALEYEKLNSDDFEWNVCTEKKRVRMWRKQSDTDAQFLQDGKTFSYRGNGCGAA